MRKNEFEWKGNNTKRLILFPLLISIIFVNGCAANNQKIINEIEKNPEPPSLSKPDDILYCEIDEDCTDTVLREDDCCTWCPEAVNVQGEKYLKGWHESNCVDRSNFSRCLEFECYGVSSIKCEDNRCTIAFDK